MERVSPLNKLLNEGEPLVTRFYRQARQAVWNTRKKWGDWLRDDTPDMEDYAVELLCRYQSRGDLDKWVIKVDGDQDQLDRYVLRRLNLDLASWARTLVRRRRLRREISYSPELMDWLAEAKRSSDIEELDILISFPFLGLIALREVTTEELAEAAGVSLSTMERWIRKEKMQVGEAYPHWRKVFEKS